MSQFEKIRKYLLKKRYNIKFLGGNEYYGISLIYS